MIYSGSMENDTERVMLETKTSGNLQADILACFDGYRVECWIAGPGMGQFIRLKGYKTLAGARAYAERFVSGQR